MKIIIIIASWLIQIKNIQFWVIKSVNKIKFFQ